MYIYIYIYHIYNIFLNNIIHEHHNYEVGSECIEIYTIEIVDIHQMFTIESTQACVHKGVA